MNVRVSTKILDTQWTIVAVKAQCHDFTLKSMLLGGKAKQPASKERRAVSKESGGDLLSHKVALAVSSALRGLTAVFGMGTGISLSPKPPQNLLG